MSYILDALTKAAQQRDRQVPVVQRLLSPAPRVRAPWSHASGRLLIALGINAVLLAAVLVWWLRPAPITAPSEPIAATPQSATSPPPSASSRSLVPRDPGASTATRLEKPAPTAAEPRADAAAQAKPSAPPVTPSPAVTPPALIQSAPVTPAAPVTPPASVAAPAPVAPPAAVAPTPPVAPAPVLTPPKAVAPSVATAPAPAPSRPRVGTPSIQPPPPAAPTAPRAPAPPEAAGLRLEALIYADAPAERMVFINGRRYREGDSIDGRLRIEEIREDGVELSDQGRRFSLRVAH